MKTENLFLNTQIQKAERFKFGIEALKEAIERVFLQKENKKKGSSIINYQSVQVFKFSNEKYRNKSVVSSDDTNFIEDIEVFHTLYLEIKEDIVDFYDRIIRNVNKQIKSLTKRISKPRITDRRSLFRAIIKFLFKNLDDAHSLLKGTKMKYWNSLIKLIQNDKSRYTNTYRFSRGKTKRRQSMSDTNRKR